MRRAALSTLAALLVLSACSKRDTPSPPSPSPPPAAAPAKVEEVVLDQLRLRPCTMKQKADDVEAAVACAREWGEVALKDHVPDPKWICAKDSSYQAYFEARSKNAAAPFAIALIYKPFMTIQRREYHELVDVPKAPECTERRPGAPPAVSSEPAAAPPIADAVRVATEHVRAHAILAPGGVAKAAGHCGPSSATRPNPKCASLGQAQWVLFTKPPEVTFFVRVDGSLKARFDEPFPDSTAVSNVAPWPECGCESLPGFDVHRQDLVKPVE